MPVLVIAEHDNQKLNLLTSHVISAALQIETPCDVLVIGHSCESVVHEAAAQRGVKKVLWIDNPSFSHPIAELWAHAILSVAPPYSAFLAPASTFGKNLMPRIAAQLGVGQISDIIAVENNTTFKRPIYAGNAIAVVESLDPIQVLTVRSIAFPPAGTQDPSAFIEKLTTLELYTGPVSSYIKIEAPPSQRPDLTTARIVVSGGRGLKSKENFHLIEALADALKGAVGASRAAVDAGYVPNECQVGQTGKIVAPELYIAIGISGAIQHIAGMKDSQCIVAINTDEEAPIFKIADFGLVADLFTVVPALTQAIKGAQTKKS